MIAVADSLDRNALVSELARAIGAVASGADDEARLIICGLAKAMERSPQATLPGVPGPPEAMSRELERRSAIGRLFTYWQRACAHGAAKLTPERARALMARLKDGYTEAEIRKAIDGAAAAAYVNEESGQRYDDLTLICRNGSKLESFMERGVRATGEIAAEPASEASPVEDQIAELRRTMSELRRAGRDTEYAHAAEQLQKLMARRGR